MRNNAIQSTRMCSTTVMPCISYLGSSRTCDGVLRERQDEGLERGGADEGGDADDVAEEGGAQLPVRLV